MPTDPRKIPWYTDLTPAQMEAIIAAVPLLLAVAKACHEEWIDVEKRRTALAALDAAHPGWREWA